MPHAHFWKEEMNATCPFLNKKSKVSNYINVWVHPKEFCWNEFNNAI